MSLTARLTENVPSSMIRSFREPGFRDRSRDVGRHEPYSCPLKPDRANTSRFVTTAEVGCVFGAFPCRYVQNGVSVQIAPTVVGTDHGSLQRGAASRGLRRSLELLVDRQCAVRDPLEDSDLVRQAEHARGVQHARWDLRDLVFLRNRRLDQLDRKTPLAHKQTRQCRDSVHHDATRLQAALPYVLLLYTISRDIT